MLGGGPAAGARLSQLQGPLPVAQAHQLAQRLIDGQLALFVGAGLSYLAPANDGSARKLPLWSELAQQIAERCHEDPADYRNDPLDLFDAIVYGQERARLEAAVRDALDDRPFAPSEAHRALAALPWSAIVTTNYDGLLARSYERPIWDDDGYDRLTKGDPLRLFQIHGTLECPHTLTREDYDLWAEKHPRAYRHLENLLLTGTALFVGYSFSDPHLRALLATIKRILGDREKRLYAWMWRLPQAKAALLDRRDKIEAFSIEEEGDWPRAFVQLAAAVEDLRVAGGEAVSRAVASDPYAYERAQYVQALEARYGAANLQGLYIWGSGYARGDVSMDEIYVEPDLSLSATYAAIDSASKASGPTVATGREASALREARRREESLARGFGRPAGGREPASRVLRRESKLIVSGAPGQGKSTLLRYRLLEAARRWREQPTAEPLPVYIRLADWEARAEGGERSLLEHAIAIIPQLGEIGSDAARAWTSRPILWLLDGVDEVRDRFERERLREEVAATSALRPRDLWVVATRPAGEPPGGFAAGFGRAEMLPLSDRKIGQVLDRWARVLEAKEGLRLDAPDIGRSLARDRGLARLRGNALLLTLAVLFYKSRHRLPHDRWEFYEVAEQVLRDSWAHHRLRRATEHLPGTYLSELLERLALAGMVHGHVLFPREELERECRAVLAARGYAGAERDRETALFLRAAEDLIGVLVAQGPDSFGFLHLTFQEFLAARALRNRSGEVTDYIGRYWDHPDWREVWALYGLAVNADATRSAELFREILAHPHPLDRRLERPRLTCLRLCGLMTGALPPAGEEIVRWAAQALEREDRMIGDQIGDALAAWERDSLPPRLRSVALQMLQGDTSARAVAVRVLAVAVGEEPIRRELVARLCDSDEQVRAQAARSLSSVAGEDDVRSQLFSLIEDESWRVGEAVVGALSSRLDREDVRRLLLQSLEYNHVGARALSSWADEPALRAELLSRLSDKRDRVRRHTIDALSTLAGEDDVRRAFLDLIEDKDSSVRLWAALELSHLTLGSEDRQELIGRLAGGDSDVRANAARALRSSAVHADVRRALLESVGDGHADVRRESASALSSLVGDSDVRRALLDRLDDEHPAVSVVAASALSSDVAEEKRVRRTLIHRLRDRDKFVRRNAVNALSRMAGADNACRALIERLEDEEDLVRRLATHSLGALAREEEVRRALITRLEDSSEYVRHEAVEALSSVTGFVEVVQALLARLDDADGGVRRAAFDALAKSIVEERQRTVEDRQPH